MSCTLWKKKIHDKTTDTSFKCGQSAERHCVLGSNFVHQTDAQPMVGCYSQLSSPAGNSAQCIRPRMRPCARFDPEGQSTTSIKSHSSSKENRFIYRQCTLLPFELLIFSVNRAKIIWPVEILTDFTLQPEWDLIWQWKSIINNPTYKLQDW